MTIEIIDLQYEITSDVIKLHVVALLLLLHNDSAAFDGNEKCNSLSTNYYQYMNIIIVTIHLDEY